jgi:hypothetical protein
MQLLQGGTATGYLPDNASGSWCVMNGKHEGNTQKSVLIIVVLLS